MRPCSQTWHKATAVGDTTKAYFEKKKILKYNKKILIKCNTMFFPQQRKLMGSSAQIRSGVCRRGSQEQVPEEGSGRFRKVPESSGVCW